MTQKLYKSDFKELYMTKTLVGSVFLGQRTEGIGQGHITDNGFMYDKVEISYEVYSGQKSGKKTESFASLVAAYDCFTKRVAVLNRRSLLLHGDYQ